MDIRRAVSCRGMQQRRRRTGQSGRQRRRRRRRASAGGQRHLAGIQTGRERLCGLPYSGRCGIESRHRAGLRRRPRGRLGGRRQHRPGSKTLRGQRQNMELTDHGLRRRRKPLSKPRSRRTRQRPHPAAVLLERAYARQRQRFGQQRPSAPGDENLFGRRRQNMEHP